MSWCLTVVVIFPKNKWIKEINPLLHQCRMGPKRSASMEGCVLTCSLVVLDCVHPWCELCRDSVDGRTDDLATNPICVCFSISDVWVLWRAVLVWFSFFIFWKPLDWSVVLKSLRSLVSFWSDFDLFCIQAFLCANYFSLKKCCCNWCAYNLTSVMYMTLCLQENHGFVLGIVLEKEMKIGVV